jgi:hypothetical protein
LPAALSCAAVIVMAAVRVTCMNVPWLGVVKRYGFPTFRSPVPLKLAKSSFYDQSHFTRMFKRQFGCTPLAYRTDAR